MLVLTRKIGEAIQVELPDGRPITVVLLEIDHGRVRLGIDAPRELPISREEWKKKETDHDQGKETGSERN